MWSHSAMARMHGLLFLDIVYLCILSSDASGVKASNWLAATSIQSVYPSFTKGSLHGRIGRNVTGHRVWSQKKLLGGSAGMTTEEKRKAHKGYCFNTRVSASLSLDRKLKNHQPEACRTSLKNKVLPSASVVIVFVDEDLSVLLRSVHSVLNRSPPKYLSGIELVDDGSDKARSPWLFDELEAYVPFLPKTRLWRMGYRSGLMAARVHGARKADGQVLVFLDSHVECADGWLQPLLARIVDDRRAAAMPVIGRIDADSFEPKLYGLGLGILGFHWRLGQKHLHHRSRQCPLLGGCPSPIMPGGIFAIDKGWFLDDLKGYDAKMEYYGGEEMEISFKLWQCGGKVELVPCSHVYHIFRDSTYWQGQVYEVPQDAIFRNKLRTAEVWMDEFADIVRFSMSPLVQGSLGSLTNAKAVREDLKCKDFKWYMEAIYPDLTIPNLTGSTVGSLNCAVNGARICLDTLGDGRRGQNLGAFGCHKLHGAQALMHTADGMLRLGTEDYTACAEPGAQGAIKIGSCGLRGAWRRDDSGQFRWKEHAKKERCLTLRPDTGTGFALTLAACRAGDRMQVWQWSPPNTESIEQNRLEL